MYPRKSFMDWARPWRQSETIDGYQTEIVRIPSSAGPKALAAGDCLSGDWAGAIRCQDGYLRVVLADVEGKGHAVCNYHQTLARHLPRPTMSPQWLADLDADWPAGRFASMAVAEVDTQHHQFLMTLAGHPAPVWRLPGDTARVLPDLRLGLVGLDLELTEGVPAAHPFPMGACLVLVSDGVLEAGVRSRGEMFGMPRLLAAVNQTSSASQVVWHILKALNEHMGGAEPEDDVTIVVVARTAAAASRIAGLMRLVA